MYLRAPLKTYYATQLLRCAVLGILMYTAYIAVPVRSSALHLGRSLRFLEVPLN
jgi:hypothetical protein